jgi:hypothetical protein
VSATSSQVTRSRMLARRVARQAPWLVDVYRASRNPRWEWSLRRDLERTRDEARFVREELPRPAASAPAALVALYRDDVFDTKVGLVLASALRPHGVRTVVYAPSRRMRRVARYAAAFGVGDVVYAGDVEPDAATCQRIDTHVNDFLAGPCDFDTVKSWRSGNCQVGNHVLSTVIRLTFDGSPDLAVEGNRALLGTVLRDVLTNYERARVLFDRIDVAFVLAEEANYSVNGPLVDAAVDRGVDVIQTVGSWRDDALISKRLTASNRREDAKALARSSFARLVAAPWTAADDEELDRDFARRYGGAWQLGTHYQPDHASARSGAEIVEELALDPAKPTAVIFAHVLWDASLFFGVDLFQNYSDWLVETVRCAVARDNMNWIVKAHPSNVFRTKHGDVTGECSELELLREAFTTLPRHVSVLRPETDISTPSLYRFADVGITVRGTPGIEMACFGKAVLTAGTSAYSELGFTVDSSSREEYLERLRTLDGRARPAPEATARARRYAHAFFVDRPWITRSFELSFEFPERGWNPLDRNVRLRVGEADTFVDAPDLAAWRTWVTTSDAPDFFGRPNPVLRGAERVSTTEER